MENLNRLLSHYAEDARVKQLLRLLDSHEPQRIILKELPGALDCFVLSGMFLGGRRSHLYIAQDKEQAAYLYNTLSNLLPQSPVFFLPDSFKRPLQLDAFSADNTLLRTEVANQLTRSKAGDAITITYPEALIEKIVAPEQLSSHRITITRNETIDLDALIRQLVDLGFERTDFVYEPGQFSIRGGIVDVFTYGNEWPYRIELYDDQVESLRTFDPLTQLSKHNVQQLSVIPNLFSEADTIPKVSLFSILPENTAIWIHDAQHLIDRIQICFEKLYSVTLASLDQDDHALLRFFREKPFIATHEVVDGIALFHLLMQQSNMIPAQQEIPFLAAPQPSVNRNFDLLVRNLQENAQRRITTYLFTDNARQIERFYQIFADLGAAVHYHPVPVSIHAGFVDTAAGIACYTDHQIFQRFHRYRLRKGFTQEQALQLRMLRELQPGDFVTHIDHGVGRYSGLEKIDINGHLQESVRLVYKNNDLLYVSIHSLHKISRYIGKEGNPPVLNKLGSDTWTNLKRKTKKKIKDIASELIKLYAQRKASPGFAFPPDGYLQNELEASFIYEDTPDQFKATQDVKEDMMKEYPMDRLVCGDVGFGKTEVAVRAAFKAVTAGKQAAILVPTTILALQHFNTFKGRLGEFGADVEYVNRFKSTAERKKIFERAKEGKIDVMIGTHGLLNKDVAFKDLGILIIDEEQKFGVAAKEKLRRLKVNVDTLTLTATPIPRTLQFSLLGARDLSIIRTPPPNRQPIHTERRVFDEGLIKDAIHYEVHRGGQVFFVHNRVKTLPDLLVMLQALCPDVTFGMAHGQMEAHTLEETLLDFIDQKIDVLLSTNIIESGLDIPNANTIIINNAHQFGLSDLHQLRGRVGRSNQKAYCYLFAPPLSVLTPEARKRLRTLEEFSDLGSGFDIAMRDLDIRGAGNLLGAEQSGFITDIGYDTYQKILEEAIRELKETDFRDLFEEDLAKQREFVRDVQIETDVEMLIPDEYVSNIAERLRLYTELDEIETDEGIVAFQQQLEDRFGRMPEIVAELFEGLRLRWHCRVLGIDRVILKNNTLRCFFLQNAQSVFYESPIFRYFLSFMAMQGTDSKLTLKQSGTNLILIRERVGSLGEARSILQSVAQAITEMIAGTPQPESSTV